MNAFVGHGVTDIDSLALAVRDPESKRLILEAISAYRGGALRSAIVSTWIAVSYDIISKVRELATQGEGFAKTFVEDLEKTIKNEVIREHQNIESSLLDNAYKQWQLLAKHEFNDMERLHKDRNLCAHPAFVVDDALFQPTPELVRTHITHALQHLLIHAPLQGKAAIERFMADIISPSFPSDSSSINSFIKTKYLDRAKDVFVKNLIETLLIVCFGKDSATYLEHKNLIAETLNEIAELKTDIFDATAKNYIERKFESIPDNLLLNVGTFIKNDKRVWDWLLKPTQIRFKTLLQNADVETFKVCSVADVSAIPDLKDIIIDRITSFDEKSQIDIISQNPKREFIKTAINIYGSANSYAQAEILGRRLMIPLAPLMDSDDIKEMLDAINGNDQIIPAWGTPEILENVFNALSQCVKEQSERHWQEFWDVMIKKNPFILHGYFWYPGLGDKIREFIQKEGKAQWPL